MNQNKVHYSKHKTHLSILLETRNEKLKILIAIIIIVMLIGIARFFGADDKNTLNYSSDDNTQVNVVPGDGSLPTFPPTEQNSQKNSLQDPADSHDLGGATNSSEIENYLDDKNIEIK